MAKRRGHREGTIFKGKDGRWVAAASLPDGKRLTKYGKTQSECREWLKETIAQIDEGLTLDGARITLKQHLERWLKDARPGLRPKTCS